MISVRFVLRSRASLRTISWKTWSVCIAGAILASTIAHAEVPGGGANGNAGDSRSAARRKYSLGGLPTSRARNSSLLFVHRPRCPPAPDVRVYLRPPLVLDGHALRLRLPGSGRADRAAVRLLCQLYPAARRWMVAPGLAEFAQERRRATCRQVGPRIAANLASLSIDRQKPAPLVALLRSCADSGRLSRDGSVAGVGRSDDDDL